MITEVGRHGKFLDIDVERACTSIMHLARAGWLRWRDELPAGAAAAGQEPAGRAGARLDDGAGFDLTEAGTQKRLAVYVVRDPADVPGIATPRARPAGRRRSPRDALAGHARPAGRTQIKGVLRDQRIIAGIGNAYSDEILHAAKMSPFKLAGSLTPDERRHAVRRDRRPR